MVNIDEMTAEQAKAYLKKLQKRTRERQRAYVKKQKQSGKRRINTFISSEAGRFLDAEMERTGKGAAAILGEALLFMEKFSEVRQPSMHLQADRHAVTHTRRPSNNPNYNQEKTEVYIMDLHRQGFSLSAIAGQLNEEGWPTQRTGGRWFHKSVGTIIKRHTLG